jgi:hypothetical protein
MIDQWWERLPNFHGYPLDPEQHPERPWWRFPSGNTLARRTDGVELLQGHQCITTDSRSTRHGFPRTNIPPEWALGGDPSWDDALAAYDKAHPLAAPPPRAGQVWAFLYDGVMQDVWIVAGHDCMAKWHFSGGGGDKYWPPEDHVLVAGPFAPWGPAALGVDP